MKNLIEIGLNETEIEIIPESLESEIAQNIRMILKTVKQSVPLDRAFGVDGALLDYPIKSAQARMSAEIVRAVREFEPRARVVKVKYGGDALGGELQLRVQFEIVSS